MKRYILVIGILALLVIFLMPVAAAAPADQRIRTSVYLLSGCDSPSDWYAECTGCSAPVGTFAMSSLYNSDDCGADNTFKKIYSVSRVPPSTQYQVVLFNQTGTKLIFDATETRASLLHPGYTTDVSGRIKGTNPTCNNGDWRNIIKTKLQNGYFVGLIQLSGG